MTLKYTENFTCNYLPVMPASQTFYVGSYLLTVLSLVTICVCDKYLEGRCLPLGLADLQAVIDIVIWICLSLQV